ncbi:unnamed protein product [Rotaria magnacalcarata]|uniref:Transposase Tc1-like domain-containing protein n=1 Tax=Rotaria magnacalcarata TaxID=392030 RepID=A0A815A2T1_9BILA|nr:unnamed protein product [Rotaria magnacalcarata]
MGVRSVKKIHRDTKIPLSTISYQLKKLRTQGSLQRRQGNGRKRKIDAKCARALGQFIRRNSEVTTISRHLNRLEYANCLPLNTPMLTEEHKERRVEWAKEHLNDDWKATIFTDESSFQLFRNTIRRWSKCAAEEKKESRRIGEKFMFGVLLVIVDESGFIRFKILWIVYDFDSTHTDEEDTNLHVAQEPLIDYSISSETRTDSSSECIRNENENNYNDHYIDDTDTNIEDFIHEMNEEDKTKELHFIPDVQYLFMKLVHVLFV